MTERRFPDGPSTLRAMRGLRALGGGGAGTSLAGVPIFLGELVRQYGGLVHWTILGRHFFLVDDPGLIEDFLVFKERDFRRGRGVQRLKRMLGEGLLSSEEPLHMRQRRLIQPAFHRERIAAYGRQMVEATLRHVSRWQPGADLDMHAEMTDLTLAIAAQTLFGADVTSDAQTIRTSLGSVMRAFPTSLSRFSELLDLFPMLPVTRNFLRARAQLDGVIYAMIAARRNDPAGGQDDLLAMLLDARDDAGAAGGSGGMDDVQVRDEALTLFMAGHETTANALTWAWYLVARHPEVAGRRLDPPAGPGRRAAAAVHARGALRDAAALSAGLDHRPARDARHHNRHASGPSRFGRPGEPARHPPEPQVLGRSRRVSARTLARRRPGAAVRFLSVRRRPAALHRRSLRLDGGGAAAGDDRPAVRLREGGRRSGRG
jgi:cytochrome P450